MKGRKFIVKIIVAIFLSMITKPISANSYNIVYMDSVKLYDTISICKSTDSIKIIPMKGIVSPMWFSDDGIDTVYQDTLYLKGSFSGLVTCQGSNGVNYLSNWIYVGSLSLSGNNKDVFCGDQANLNVSTNYKGNGTIQYNWIPTTGLSNSKISNPVAAVKNDIKYTVTMSTSDGCNASTEVSVTLKPMDAPMICIVSVDSTNKNILYWGKTISAIKDSFYIYRETNVSNVYKKIGTVSSANEGVYIDTLSFPDIQSNKYAISIKDSCEFESVKSISHKTMHLTINQGQNNSWNLIWEPYEGIEVSSYYIYRGLNSKDMVLIGTTSGSSTQYSDFNAPSGYVYYQIEVVSPSVCNIMNKLKSAKVSSFYNISHSNIATNRSTGISKVQNESKFSIYPNPADNQLYIELSKNETIKGIIEITNIEGQTVKTSKFNSRKLPIDVSDLKSGFYTIMIETEQGIFKQKFVKK